MDWKMDKFKYHSENQVPESNMVIDFYREDEKMKKYA
jgi:hypothetical protein